MNTATVHWLGAGLSSRPGFKKLVESRSSRCLLWNRNGAKAIEWAAEIGLPHVEGRTYSKEALVAELRPGDLIVSMLPAELHPTIARIALGARAHLVTTSYLSPQMRAFDAEARACGLVFMNEVGLDPGIDHLFAHLLVERLDTVLPPENRASIDFHSLCGGFPKEVRDTFRYRFSWSPLGVLRALKNPARWREDGADEEAAPAYARAREWWFGGEGLEMYPNRDSLVYAEEYGLPLAGNKTRTFIRGTLRPSGWASGWTGIFARIETATASEFDLIAHELYREFSYREGERDRVCMEVKLSARDARGVLRFEESYRIDDSGDALSDSAMARLVSYPAVLAVESILGGEIRPGVSGAPKHPQIARAWVDQLLAWGCKISMHSGSVEIPARSRDYADHTEERHSHV